jgi:hypothetical protein
MSPWYGGYQTKKPLPYTTTIYATTSCYIEALKYYSTKVLDYLDHNLLCSELLHRRPELHHQGIGVLHDYVWCPILLHRGPGLLSPATYYTDAPKYFSVLRNFTETPAYYSTKTVEYYTEAPKNYSAPVYTSTTEAEKYYASRLTTQKLFLRITLNINTTLMF